MVGGVDPLSLPVTQLFAKAKLFPQESYKLFKEKIQAIKAVVLDAVGQVSFLMRKLLHLDDFC